MMRRGRPGDVKREPFIVRSGELIGWALGGVEREIAQTRKHLSVLTARAGKLRARLASLKRGKAAAATSTVTGKRKHRRTPTVARKRFSKATRTREPTRKRRQK